MGERVGGPRTVRRAGAVVAALLMSFGAVVFDGPMAGAVSSHTLPSGSVLSSGTTLQSSDSRFVVAMQTDGNLVLYAQGRAVWSSGSAGNSGAVAPMQTDGNLVVYTSGGSPRWSSGTAGNPGGYGVIQDDGNFVVYSATGQPRWQSGTAGVLDADGSRLPSGYYFGADNGLVSRNGNYVVVLQTDGNVVLYRYPGTAMWQTRTYGTPSPGDNVMLMADDGNLVVLDVNNVVRWQSGTAGNPGAFAVLQNDGNFVVYTAGGRPLWGTGAFP